MPPFVLRQIAERGTERQRSVALATLARDQTMRLARLQNRPAGSRAATDVLAQLDPAGPNPTIRDARNREEVTVGPIVRREGDPPSGDPAADEAYDGLGDTYDLFADVFRRDSIDDAGMPLRAVVHFGVEYDNAFWDGQRVVFGDGDGELFNRFTLSLDVIGHELGHGVTEHDSGLGYLGETGALNESLSDVFGSLVKQRTLGQTAEEADWLIGAELLGPAVSGQAMRSMRAPGTAYDDDVLGKDPQPAHFDDFVRTTEDNGGVHINSGIPNRAFFLVATDLGGPSWERAGRIWYEANREPQLRPTATFAQFAQTTERVAVRLFGRTSTEARVVRDGWEQVGVRWR